MITVSDLCMHYGPVVALHKATFNVERGEVVGLLGPNGAGKSTTMKLLTTYLYPTFGNATVGGKSIRNEAYEVRQLIGYLPEVLPLYPDMEVRAYLDFVGRARGLRGGRLRQREAWVSRALWAAADVPQARPRTVQGLSSARGAGASADP